MTIPKDERACLIRFAREAGIPKNERAASVRNAHEVVGGYIGYVARWIRDNVGDPATMGRAL